MVCAGSFPEDTAFTITYMTNIHITNSTKNDDRDDSDSDWMVDSQSLTCNWARRDDFLTNLIMDQLRIRQAT